MGCAVPATAPYLHGRLNFIHDKVANEDKRPKSFEVQPLRCEERFLMTSQLPSSPDKLTSAWHDSERPIKEGAVPSKQGPATLADVAASAGVSIATVSKVLNGRADVGPGTRARVQTILQQHDYIGRRSEPV